MSSEAPTPTGPSADSPPAGRFPGWPIDAWSGFLGGVLASLLLLGLLTWKAEWVADLTLGANPSCSSPRGLREVPIVNEKAGSTQAKKEDGAQPAGVSTDSDDYFVAKYAVDNAANTVWIPEIVNDDDRVAEDATSREPTFLTEGDANLLTLTLDDVADVRLVCVVNGAALWYVSYQNWGRVRTVEVWGDDGEKKLGTLQSLGSEDFPNAQVAGRNLGDTDTVHIELVDAYAGIQVENFNARACLDDAKVTLEDGTELDAREWFRGQQVVHFADRVLKRWPDGCIQEPKVKAGIAEVRVYATD